MTSDQLLLSTYPPDISCFTSPGYAGNQTEFKANNCSITSNMVNFLNLTGTDYNGYFAAYCLNPPDNDDCPFGYCPNPDIAGSLVRVANYIIGFCLAILIFYDPKRVNEAFWSQALITYSLLLTCGISLIQGELTRFHSIVLTSIVCSPVNVYFTGYAVRSFWGTPHRLHAVLGKEKYKQRATMFFSVAVWIAILIYAYLPRRYTKFAQDSCGSSPAEAFFLGTPFVYAWILAIAGKGGILLLFSFLAIPILIAFAWVVAIFHQRHVIWGGEPYRPKFSKVWRTVVNRYPFLLFWSTVVIPTVYWMAIIELGILSENDDDFSLTFGQVLAVFAALPPMIEVAYLASKLRSWSTNLAWVRFINRRVIPFITGRPAPEAPDPKEMGAPDLESMKGTSENKDGYD